jgi:flagellar assembly protein FliH
MSRILKLDDGREDQVSDYQRDALEEVRGESGNSTLDPAYILAEARAEAERKVQEAYTEGHRRGVESGEAEFKTTVGEAADIIEQVVASLEESRKSFLDELEPQLAHLAQAIAARILTYEASHSEEVVRQMARAVLESVLDQEQVTLRVHPGDLEVLRAYREDLLRTFEGIKQLELIPDPSVETGGCVAETSTLVVDGQLTTRLQHIIDHLMGV